MKDGKNGRGVDDVDGCDDVHNNLKSKKMMQH